MPFSLAIVALVAGYTWVAHPLVGRAGVAPVAVAVLALGAWHARRSGDLGWSSKALVPGLLASAAFTAAMAGALLAVARAATSAGTAIEPARFTTGEAAWFLLWAGAQQWLLQTTFLREAASRFRARPQRAPVVAALLFGALHLPNPALTVLTTLAAIGWCAIYRRWPNVLPLALSHAVGTMIVEMLFDETVTGRLRVGYSYLQL